MKYFLMACLLLTGCATQPDYNKLFDGQTKAKVIAVNQGHGSRYITFELPDGGRVSYVYVSGDPYLLIVGDEVQLVNGNIKRVKKAEKESVRPN